MVDLANFRRELAAIPSLPPERAQAMVAQLRAGLRAAEQAAQQEARRVMQSEWEACLDAAALFTVTQGQSGINGPNPFLRLFNGLHDDYVGRAHPIAGCQPAGVIGLALIGF